MPTLYHPKPDVTYVFRYRDTPDGRLAMLFRLGVLAHRPDVSFTWSDARDVAARVQAGNRISKLEPSK